MDRQTDRQADKSDFIGCCPTNVECPKKGLQTHSLLIKK